MEESLKGMKVTQFRSESVSRTHLHFSTSQSLISEQNHTCQQHRHQPITGGLLIIITAHLRGLLFIITTAHLRGHHHHHCCPPEGSTLHHHHHCCPPEGSIHHHHHCPPEGSTHQNHISHMRSASEPYQSRRGDPSPVLILTTCV